MSAKHCIALGLACVWFHQMAGAPGQFFDGVDDASKPVMVQASGYSAEPGTK